MISKSQPSRGVTSNTGSTSTTTTTSSILKRTKQMCMDFFSAGAVVDFKFFSLLAFTGEIVWMLSTIMVLLGHMLHWTAIGEVVEFVLIWVEPLEPIHDITIYTIFYIIIVLLILFVIDVIIWTEHLNGTNSMTHPPRCYEFPYSLFFISGIILTFLVCLIVAVDILFFLDKFKNIKYLTSSVDGRFLFHFFATTFSQILLFHLFEEYEQFVASGVLLVYIFLALYYVRFTPHYSKCFSFIWTNFLVFVLTIQISFVVVDWSKNYFTFFTLMVIVVISPILNLLVFTRFLLIKFLYSGERKMPRYNLFLCYNASDFGLICYLNKKDKQVIANILKKKKFLKSQRIVHILFPMVIKDVQFSTHIIRHTESMRGKCLFDTSFALFFYSSKLHELHESSTKLDAKSIRRLKKIHKHENRLSTLYQRLFSLSTSNQTTGVSRIFTSLVYHDRFVEKSYLNLMKAYPSARIYRKYGSYLLKFHNDQSSAKFYFEEARRLDFTHVVYPSDRSNISNLSFNDDNNDQNLNKKKKKKKNNKIIPLNSIGKVVRAIGRIKSPKQEEEEEEESVENKSSSTSSDEEPFKKEYIGGETTETEEEEEEEEEESEDDDKTVNIIKDLLVNNNDSVPNVIVVETPKSIPQNSILTQDDEYLSIPGSIKDDDDTDNEEEEQEEEEDLEISPKKKEEQQQQQKQEEEDKFEVLQPSSMQSMISRTGTDYTTGSRSEFFSDIYTNDLEGEDHLRNNNKRRKGGKGKGGNSNSRYLRKKKTKNFCSSYFSCCSLLITGIIFLGLVIAIFVMTLEIKRNFERVTQNIDDITAMREKSISIAFFVRKLQTSSYDETRTPLEVDRDTTQVRLKLKDYCDDMKVLSRNAYIRMSNIEERLEWNKLVPLIEEYEDGSGKKDEHIMYLSVYDTINLISHKCYDALKLTDSECANRTKGYRMEDHDFFHLIEENHDTIYNSMESLLKIELELTDKYQSLMTTTSLTFPPIMLFIPLLLFFLTCFCSCCEMKREIKGLRLIPKEEAMKKVFYFTRNSISTNSSSNSSSTGGGAGSSTINNNNFNYEKAASEIGNLTERTKKTENMFDEGNNNNNNNTNELISSQLSLGWITVSSRMFCYNSICAIICTTCITFFVALLIVSMDEFHDRDVEYAHISQLTAESRHLHFVLMDVLYRDDSIHLGLEVFEELKNDIEHLHSIFTEIRTGNEDEGLHGIDNTRMNDLKHIFYEESCSYNEVSDHMVTILNCLSLSDLFLVYLEAFEQIEYQVTIAPNITKFNINGTSETRIDVEYDILKSDLYKEIFIIDNPPCNGEIDKNCKIQDSEGRNGTIPSEGYLHKKINEVKEFIRTHDDTNTQILNNGVWILLILITPLLLFISFILLFSSSFDQMNRYLMMPRQILYLMSDKVLLKNRVIKFLNGESSRSKILLFQRDRQRKEFVNLIQYSNYSILIFVPEKFMISHYNRSAADLFGFHGGKLDELIEDGTTYCSLNQIMTNESIIKIKNWMKNIKKQQNRWTHYLLKKRKRRKRKNKEENKEEEEEERSYDKYNNFQGELIGITVSGEEFRILVDISYYHGRYLCIIENIESSKKKQILREAEKQSSKTEKLLQNMLPAQIAELMKNKNIEQLDIVNKYKNVTAIFADIVDFTPMMEKSNPALVVRMINGLFSGIDDLTTKYGIEKIKTIGDCYFAVCGLPTYRPNHATEGMRFSIALLEWVEEFNKQEETNIHMRVGLSSGPVVAGVIGKKKWCFDVWGRTINVAARMESLAVVDKIMVSRSTYEYVFDRFDFMKRMIQVQGIGFVDCYVFKGLLDRNSTVDLIPKMNPNEFSSDNLLSLEKKEEEEKESSSSSSSSSEEEKEIVKETSSFSSSSDNIPSSNEKEKDDDNEGKEGIYDEVDVVIWKENVEKEKKEEEEKDDEIEKIVDVVDNDDEIEKEKEKLEDQIIIEKKIKKKKLEDIIEKKIRKKKKKKQIIISSSEEEEEEEEEIEEEKKENKEKEEEKEQSEEEEEEDDDDSDDSDDDEEEEEEEEEEKEEKEK